MVVKYCFCLYWLWIATYRNKWIYLKIHILRLSLFYILLTFLNLNFNSQTHFHCSSSSGVSDLALIRIPARQKTRKSDLLPTERDKLNCLTKTFFSFTHFFFFIALWGQDRKLILSKWLPARHASPEKTFQKVRESKFSILFPVFSLWSCDKKQITNSHLNITLQKNEWGHLLYHNFKTFLPLWTWIQSNMKLTTL